MNVNGAGKFNYSENLFGCDLMATGTTLLTDLPKCKWYIAETEQAHGEGKRIKVQAICGYYSDCPFQDDISYNCPLIEKAREYASQHVVRK